MITRYWALAVCLLATPALLMCRLSEQRLAGRIATPVAATVAALPTSTPYPTPTPYPTATAYPTYTLYPTPTPLPSATPYPTPTLTPSPTYTPYPTPEPTRPCCVCEPYAPDEHTLLLLHFDGYYAGAQDEPGTAEGTSFAEGRFGQGVLIDNADKLSYPTEGNLRPEAGAIEFWVRPNFDAHSGRVHTFFETEDPKSSGGIQIAMDGDLGFLFWTAEGSTGISANVLDWQAGDWHHVAAIWQGYDMALFVDGRRVASSNAANPPAVLGDAFRVGSTPNLGWQADAVIDELRISDIPRLGKGDACGRSW